MQLCLKEVINWREQMIIPRTESIYKTIEGIGPDQGSVVAFATWLGQIAHFKPILTGDGLCYTFNALNSRDIYSDELRTIENSLCTFIIFKYLPI